MKFSYHFICFTRLWMGIGVPGDPKVNFWVSVGYRSGYRSGECLGPRNFDKRTRAVQEHASTTFDAAGSAETFFALLCITHAYNRTHVYYSSIRLRYRFWEFTVSVSMLSRHKHQHRPHMKGFLHEPFCLWLKWNYNPYKWPSKWVTGVISTYL